MEGILFYWFAWISWTGTTFFMPKTKERLCLSGFLLILIYSTNFTFHIGQYSVNAALFLLAIISYAYIGMLSLKRLTYSIIVSMILSVVYIGLHIIVLTDPVWVMFGLEVFMAVPVAILSLILLKELQLPILIAAYIHGEIAYTYLFQNTNTSYITGSVAFLDYVSMAIAIVFAWTAYVGFINKVKLRVDKPTKHVKEGIH
ncbi:YphA family membrane protein [Pseudalkalibacillus berkeleyi]|uniref:Uncharacterized protein n=1 Tax=Pseudalkalibacillus berkeleyi TaxID=1069813 RepID=A0ABS9H1T0_9BACL|nr:hypothetical protein [Pseudalkalibacillus berkeleyi]MCF6137590.1 hypothetical protein [Pseudalkalibacillus berkeleyi]